jgi:hypothetical protein
MDKRVLEARNGTAGRAPTHRFSLRGGILRDAWLTVNIATVSATSCLVRSRLPVHITAQFYSFVPVRVMAGESLILWRGSYLKVHQSNLPSLLDQTLGICRSLGIVRAVQGEQEVVWASPGE